MPLTPRALAVLVLTAALAIASGAVLASERMLRYRWVRAKIGLTALVVAAGVASLVHQFAAAATLRGFGVLALVVVLALSVLRCGGGVKPASVGRHRLTPGDPQTRTTPAELEGEADRRAL
jgi:hypothetical protein